MLTEAIALVWQSEGDFAVAGSGDHFGVEKSSAIVALV